MKTFTSTRALSLSKAGTKRIPDPAGVEMTCTSGSIWITLEGILHDVILTAGTADDTFVTRSHRSALIYALSDSEVVIAMPAAVPAAMAASMQHAPVQRHCEPPMTAMFQA